MPHDPQYASGVERQPILDRLYQSNRKGLHVIGAAKASPLLKTCINEGYEVVRSISRVMPPDGAETGDPELAIVGAGPAGIAAALEAKKRGYRILVLEQAKPLNTIHNFPDGKLIYAEPTSLATLGQLGLEDSSKEDLLADWGDRLAEIEITCGADIQSIDNVTGGFELRAASGDVFRAKRVILAIGRIGKSRLLGVPGEDLGCTYTALHNPGKYRDKEILVVGGGNSAVEAALALSGANRVRLVHRSDGFHRASAVNRSALEAAQASGKIKVHLSSSVSEFRANEADVAGPGGTDTVDTDASFILIGSDPPSAFLGRLGLRFEGQWRWSLLPQMLWVFALVYSLYAIKAGRWPYAGVYAGLKEIGADPSLLYGILYSGLMSVFGLKAMAKYKDSPMQRRRFTSLIGAQWLIYFILPWALYYAGHSEWWRSWAVTLTYPLGYYGLFEPASSLFSGSSLPWAIATIAAFLFVMPVVATYHGKRFCSWFCPCGGIAETAGDAWRHKAPRGTKARRLESASTVLLVLTLLVSVYLISGYRGFINPDGLKSAYVTIVDFGLASIVAIALYPFSGTRIWCRFLCPLAKWLELWGRWTGGKLAIRSNDECISCGECNHHCQMGIDVRSFAQRSEDLSNSSTVCVFCGICVEVCPVDVLSVGRRDKD